MRYLDYPGRGRPPSLTQELEELLVLTLGAIESVNVERWALTFGASSPPVLPGKLRTSSYETDVVGAVHRLGQRYWERRGEAAVWERPFPTGVPGRPAAVDIALFSKDLARETRLEFGQWTPSKLKEDSVKLADLASTTQDGYEHVESYVSLWTERANRMTREARKRLKKSFADGASKVDKAQVDLLCVTGFDAFAENNRQHRSFALALFRVEALRPASQLAGQTDRGGVDSGT